jgi:hypothetical protein
MLAQSSCTWIDYNAKEIFPMLRSVLELNSYFICEFLNLTF